MKCPVCWEEISPVAQKCPHCLTDFRNDGYSFTTAQKLFVWGVCLVGLVFVVVNLLTVL